MRNLILFSDKWSGNPAAQIWGGENHHFVSNEVVMGSNASTYGYPDPVGIDGTRIGKGICSFNTSAGNKQAEKLLGHIHSNTYWTQDGEWATSCQKELANGTTVRGNSCQARTPLTACPNTLYLRSQVPHRWSLKELRKVGGRGVGSTVTNAADLTVEMVSAKAKKLLRLKLDDEASSSFSGDQPPLKAPTFEAHTTHTRTPARASK